MVAVLSLLLAAAALLAISLFRAAGALKGENLKLCRQLQVVAELPTVVTGTDWQQSVQQLVNRLVGSGVTPAAALLSLSDNGHLELRSVVSASADRYADRLPGEAAHRAMELRESVRCASGDLLLPVIEDGEPVGILAVRGDDPDVPALRAAAALGGLILGGIKASQRQSALSTTDGLTGLANHRHFQQMLGIALGQSYLEGEALSLILLDIDHFKAVNDNHGHLLGDLVLREIAYLLRRELPPGATAARYGGEEMAVILPGPQAVNAPAFAERMRQAIEHHEICDFTTGARLNVTVSLGVAAYELGQGKSRLIARADEAMYTSKREGRNRMTVAALENGTSHLFPS
jgi:diguanylate cyclase (GGDEF)-like protein